MKTETSLNHETPPIANVLLAVRLIANFMGWVNSPYPNLPNKVYNSDLSEGKSLDQFKYDEKWDELMPVLEKICRLKIGDAIKTIDYPNLRTFGMINKETKGIMVRLNGFQVFEAETLIEATFLAVVDFLEWLSKADR